MTWLTHWLTDWLTDWQGHLLSCPGQLKRHCHLSKKNCATSFLSRLRASAGGMLSASFPRKSFFVFSRVPPSPPVGTKVWPWRWRMLAVICWLANIVTNNNTTNNNMVGSLHFLSLLLLLQWEWLWKSDSGGLWGKSLPVTLLLLHAHSPAPHPSQLTSTTWL